MIVFNAVSIEHTLARFFNEPVGKRGLFFDADIFRWGVPEDLAEVLRKVADRLEFRTSTFKYPPAPEGKGSAEAAMHHCIFMLREMADQIAARTKRERENYHWEIFGALMSGITALVETIEAQERPN